MWFQAERNSDGQVFCLICLCYYFHCNFGSDSCLNVFGDFFSWNEAKPLCALCTDDLLWFQLILLLHVVNPLSDTQFAIVRGKMHIYNYEIWIY